MADPFEGAYSFRGLAMWQKAQELACDIIDLVEKLPTNRAAAIVAQQVIRSATSIAANIAEGHGRFTPATYRNHLSIARGSTAETVSWLDLMRRRHWIGTEAERLLLVKCAELMRMLTAKMRDLEGRPPNRVSDERIAYDASAIVGELPDA